MSKENELKIKMLKSLEFDFGKQEPSIEVSFSPKSIKLIDEIKKIDPLFDYEKYIDEILKRAIEDSLKEYENK